MSHKIMIKAGSSSRGSAQKNFGINVDVYAVIWKTKAERVCWKEELHLFMDGVLDMDFSMHGQILMLSLAFEEIPRACGVTISMTLATCLRCIDQATELSEKMRPLFDREKVIFTLYSHLFYSLYLAACKVKHVSQGVREHLKSMQPPQILKEINDHIERDPDISKIQKFSNSPNISNDS